MIVNTDPPSCGCGFMSIERMRNLLNVDTVSAVMHTDQRQQISPEMRFTCDGMITKWFIGADFSSTRDLYPEYQIWRNVGDKVYRKVNNTPLIQLSFFEGPVFEFFAPIEVRSGDILGILIPPEASSKVRLWSEEASSPTQYYVTTTDTTSVNVIDIEQSSVTASFYHPLITVEFGK